MHLPLTALIYKEKFELIHLHEYLKTTLFEHYPKVMHFHNDPLPGCDDDAAFAREAPAYWGQVGKSLRQIGVSEYLASRLRLAHDLAGEGASDANIVRVPNGVHANAIPPQARSEARRQTREKAWVDGFGRCISVCWRAPAGEGRGVSRTRFRKAV